MDESDRLLDTLEAVNEAADGDTVAMGDIIDCLQERGYGPLITMLSAFVALPTGAIPGIPAVIGLCLLLIGLAMILGKTSPWFPGFIRRFEVDSDRLRSAVDKARPWARRLRGVLTPRLTVLSRGPVANRIAALCVILAALIMMALGFVPFLPLVLGLALVLPGLGITARDGVVVLIAYAIVAAGCTMAWTFTG